MNAFFEKTIGVGHFLFDRRPANIPSATPKSRASQAISAWTCSAGRASNPVGRAAGAGKAISLLGSLPQAIRRGDRVMVKPNFNSADPFPASTDLDFLRAVIEMLLDAGATVTVGEGAGGMGRPTDNVFRKVGLHELAKQLGITLTVFEDKASDWLRIKIDGDYLKTVTMPRSAYEADKLVYVPCMKGRPIIPIVSVSWS